MAQTKVKLVSNGVITVDNLHTNHGITTDHIGEGSVLYYTDARVQNYLTTNNYITTTDVTNLETVTSLGLNANILSYTNEAGVTTNIDLSLYLDDTNLARLVSGTLDGGTGIATFTRDDASTFTVDFSAFLSDANDYVTSASFNTADGVLTLTRLGGGTVTVDLDNRYLTSFTETDPIYTASSWYTTTNNSSNWNTAFGWGNHASAGYLTSFTESDPTVPAHVKSITSTNISNWNTAYSWGNHAAAGYQSASTAITTSNIGSQSVNFATTAGSANAVSWGNVSSKPGNIMYYQGFTLDANTMDSNATGFTYSVNSPFTGPISRISAGGNYDLWLGGTYSGGNAFYIRTKNGDNGTINPWRQIITDGNIGSQSVANAATANGANGNFYVDDNYGNTIVGLYESTRYQGVWAMGNAYKLPADGTTTGNLYGLAWSHPNAGGVAGNLNDHGLLVINNGVFASAISSSIRAAADMRAPIFYDSNNTAYYVDPASTSNLYNLTLTGAKHTYLYINPGNSNEAMVRYNGGSGSGWYVGKRVTNQLVGSESFHFYSEAAARTLAGIDTAGNMLSDGSMRSPIFYDSNNTGYYVDPASATSLRTVGSWRADSAGWDGEFAGKIQYHSDRWYFQFNTMFHFRNSGGSNIVEGDASGNLWAYGSSRSPIFYDYNDTSRYVDPNGTTVINTLRVHSSSDYYSQNYFYSNQGGYSGSLSSPGLQAYSTSNNSAYMSFHKGGYYAVNMGLDADNVLRIGGWSAAANRFQMDMSGNLTMAGDITAYSDARVKENIVTIDNALEKVKKARGVYYNRTDSEDKKTKIGVIAQEILEVIPEVVNQDNDGMYNVSYGNLTALLIEAIKEQQKQIEELKQLINK